MKVSELLEALYNVPFNAEVVVADCRSGVTHELCHANMMIFTHKEFGELEGLGEEGDTIVELSIR